MKTHKFVLTAIQFLLATNFLFPQGEAAIPFLVFPVSPAQNAMGATGTSLPTDDAYGFLFNPAQLGYTSQSNNLSFLEDSARRKYGGAAGTKLKQMK